MTYAEKLKQGGATVEASIEDTGTPQSLDFSPPLQMTESQKQYLTDVFQTGEQTGRKADSNNVSKLMRKVRNAHGSFTFDASSYLTSQQVASFFFTPCRKESCSRSI